jgi:TetR/AcrR family transcriptional regulator, tetracycline repressor protein
MWAYERERQCGGAVPARSRAMPPRTPRLARAAVLDAALATIDRVGLHGLTIRALANELGVAPMTLYSHFRRKSDLLDLTFEHLLHRLVPTQRHATWQREFEAVCRDMRRELLAHPHWISLLTRAVVPRSALDIYDRLLDLMSKDGFQPEAAMTAFSSAMSLVLGSVLVERMMGGAPPVPRQRLALIKGMVHEFPAGRYPRVAVASQHFDRWTFDAVFELQLRSMLVGLESGARRRRGGTPSRSV